MPAKPPPLRSPPPPGPSGSTRPRAEPLTVSATRMMDGDALAKAFVRDAKMTAATCFAAGFMFGLLAAILAFATIA